MPRISIVIPLYNKERYIRRTLVSVLSQTFEDFECIIIDSSNDGSSEIVRKFSDSRIRHLIQKERTYLPIARNIGINASSSDLIAFIDADDEWAPDHLEAIFGLAERYPDAGLYATPYIKIRPDGSEMVMIFAGIPNPPWNGYIARYFRICARGDVPICSSSCAIRKKVFLELGGFSEDLIDGGEDHEMWGRIALRYPIAFTWDGPGIYHTDATGRMCNDPKKEIIDPMSEKIEILLKNGCLSDELKDDLILYANRRKKTKIFSKLITGLFIRSSRSSDDYRTEQAHGNHIIMRAVAGAVSGIFIQLYDSRFHNQMRRLWCMVHGWHIPTYRK